MMSEKIFIELKNNVGELERLSQILTQFGEANKLSPKVLFAINLALEEILTNTINYGYKDNHEHKIKLAISLEYDELTVKVEDDGQAFNPLEAPEPDTDKPLQERQIGGLGIHLVRNLMDKLEYRRWEGRNMLVMKKKATS
jgi:anti-sigma regulatory factor (Ser/Thr protein kinase)